MYVCVGHSLCFNGCNKPLLLINVCKKSAERRCRAHVGVVIDVLIKTDIKSEKESELFAVR